MRSIHDGDLVAELGILAAVRGASGNHPYRSDLTVDGEDGFARMLLGPLGFSAPPLAENAKPNEIAGLFDCSADDSAKLSETQVRSCTR
jgi:hypothetical protein